MEDLNSLFQLSENYPAQLEQMTEEFLVKLRIILWGQQSEIATNNIEKFKDLPTASPQQTKKRIKRLSSLTEDNEVEDKLESFAPDDKNIIKPTRKSKRSNAELLALVDFIDDNKKKEDESHKAEAGTKCADSTTSKSEKEINSQEIMRNSGGTNLMPPPPVPIIDSADETLNKRPQRAARVKSEKNLKEPTLKTKLRRPTNEEVKIKLEHEQRQSQMHEAVINTKTSVNNKVIRDSLSSQKSDDSVFVIPGKQPSIVSINSDIEDAPLTTVAGDITQTAKEQSNSVDSTDSGIQEVREIRIKIKRENVSLNSQDKLSEVPSDKAVFKVPEPLPLPMSVVKNETTAVVEKSFGSSVLSSTTNTTNVAAVKKTRKKKDVVHKPIKVERFSDLDQKPSPISSRTRSGNLSKTDDNETKETKRPASIYEDAVEIAPSNNSNKTHIGGVANETVNLGPSADGTMNLGPASGDATFCTNPAQTTFQVAPCQTTFVMDSNPNATVTLNKHSGAALADATFDINQEPKSIKDKEDDALDQRSFETAKDLSMPHADSLLTEDEQEIPIVPKSKLMSAKDVTKTSNSAKAVCKMPTRTKELFNPTAQSPVKLRVEAFENAIEQSKRPLRNRKENVTPTSATTPVIGKLPAPALGRFLTPTQCSNIVTSNNSAIAKKGTTSASKALPMSKSTSASSLIRSNSTISTKTLQNDSAADDFRKGLHNLAEERKKQREQKHLLAAQQREAKERERAERMAKLAKEREEKRTLKKQQEQEQKKRDLEEIQRKLRQQQEEAAKLKASKEREILLQMKQQQLAKQKLMPPPQKTASKYTFEMLHEDDSTDDEDKVSYKRPPPPSWSRKHVRGPIMLKQEYTPSAYIDSFFSVQPMTPDLKMIFPNIDARYLKRNSSVFWSTPPRYSELPKY